MAITEIQKQTNANIQEKANLIWEIATHLVGLYKPHEYGKVILPMTVLKRFDDALAPTKQKVLEENGIRPQPLIVTYLVPDCYNCDCYDEAGDEELQDECYYMRCNEECPKKKKMEQLLHL